MKEKKTCTALIVDDSPEDRETMSRLLMQSRNCLYSILEADDARGGLELCHQVHIDCVLLDFELPDCNGIEFLDALRNKHNDVRAPVVMVTGHGSEQVVVRAMKAGAVDYLSKDTLCASNLQDVTQNALEKLTSANNLVNEARQRQLAEEKLRTNEAYFRALIDSVTDCGLILLNEEGRILSWNAGARNLFNLHDYEIMGQSFQRLFVEGTAEAGAADVLLAQEAETSTTSKAQRMLRNGQGSFLASYTLSRLTRIGQQERGFALFVRELERQAPNAESSCAAAVHEPQQHLPTDTLEALRALHRQLRVALRFAEEQLSPFGNKMANKIQPCLNQLHELTRILQHTTIPEGRVPPSKRAGGVAFGD